ncbi:hypothetical protein OSSY52_00430 [Tepiditoga spiralis]|uniref:Uncharacterized protein n=1 Tax=Tepiditoga spiralis TaxID=2108365 RepID=A0A7G1G7A8_9BACT|nr:hypothetical protein [Tepiditoga spiralis]BBE29902.1 hypothetical protein OSSY52_00430 [Tepiditoga spiralis]
MKKTKRGISWLILFTFILTMMPMNAFATKNVSVNSMSDSQMSAVVGGVSPKKPSKPKPKIETRYFHGVTAGSAKIIYKGPEKIVSAAVDNMDYKNFLDYSFEVNESTTNEFTVSGEAEFLDFWKASGGYTHHKTKSYIGSFVAKIPPRHQGFIVKYKEKIEWSAYSKKIIYKDGVPDSEDNRKGTKINILDVYRAKYIKISY